MVLFSFSNFYRPNRGGLASYQCVLSNIKESAERKVGKSSVLHHLPLNANMPVGLFDCLHCRVRGVSTLTAYSASVPYKQDGDGEQRRISPTMNMLWEKGLWKFMFSFRENFFSMS